MKFKLKTLFFTFLLIFSLFLSVFATSTVSPNDYVIKWQDDYFESVIRSALSKPEGDIYKSELDKILYLNIVGDKYVNINSASEVDITFDSGLMYTVQNENYSTFSNFTTLEDLKHFENLQYLALYFVEIEQIESLSNLSNLNTLILKNCNLSDISFIENMNTLNAIDLSYNNISNLQPLSKNFDLLALNLSYNSISDISHLKNLKNIKELTLSENNIKDISPIQNFSTLQKLHISNNEIEDILPLTKINTLITLDLSYNNISDLYSISNLKKLNSLFLQNNYIYDVSELAQIDTLQLLDIDFNRISDISSVRKISVLNFNIETQNTIAYEKEHRISVDDKVTALNTYALYDSNGYEINYLRLTDLANLLDNTNAEFNIFTSQDIILLLNTDYTNGSGISLFSGDKEIKMPTQSIIVETDVYLDSFSIADNFGTDFLFVKLRDLADVIGFTVEWDNGIKLNTN